MEDKSKIQFNLKLLQILAQKFDFFIRISSILYSKIPYLAFEHTLHDDFSTKVN